MLSSISASAQNFHIAILVLIWSLLFNLSPLVGQKAPPIPENKDDFDALLRDYSTDNSESFSVIIKKKDTAKKIVPPPPRKPPQSPQAVPEPPPPPPQVVEEEPLPPVPATPPTRIYPNSFKNPPTTNPYKTSVRPNRYAINQFSPEDSQPLAQARSPSIPNQPSDYLSPPRSKKSLPPQKLSDPGLFPDLAAPEPNNDGVPSRQQLYNSVIPPTSRKASPNRPYRLLDRETLPDRALIEGLYTLSDFEPSNTHITPPFDEKYFNEKKSYLNDSTRPQDESPVPLGTDKTLGLNPTSPYELLGKDADSEAFDNNQDFLSPPVGSLTGRTPQPLKKLATQKPFKESPLIPDDPAIFGTDTNTNIPAYFPQEVNNRFIDPLFSDRYKNNSNLQRILSNQPLPQSEADPILTLPQSTNQTVRSQPDNNEILLILIRARQLALAQNYVNALFLLRFVELKAPNNTLMLNMKGSVYYKINRLQSSLAYWGRSLKINPYQPLVRAYYNRIQSYLTNFNNTSLLPN
ncbi:hypothetical protein COTS27_01137 [Spirochaetota bacterium]|nr:hypothetical protein COTS27_01137 [Spirochaetota bacterium]